MQETEMAIRVGTASWTDKTLIDCKKFYPAMAKSPEQRLRYYASRFPLVEVDSSYYAMPKAANADLWAQRTPKDFKMNVKAFRLMTGHQTSPTVMPADLVAELPENLKAKPMLYARDLPRPIVDAVFERFLLSLEPLRTAGKLGMIHFQFAPWVLRSRRDKEHIAYCVEKMAGCEVSVEFRNNTWFAADHLEETLAMLRDLDVTHTVVDEPQGFNNSVPHVWAASNPRQALVRLHGRNHETWNIKGASAASDRFNYDYSQLELEGLADDIRRLSDQVFDLDVIFNNNYEDQGQRNAQTLMDILGAQAIQPPLDFGDNELPF
jgi:uncharacterized protein YecE (DUF72 family)